MRKLSSILICQSFLIALSLSLACTQLTAQRVDFNQIVPPEGQRPATFEDYLVQLAWLNNPETEILGFKKTKEEKEVALQRQKWMEDVKMGFNINEVSLSNLVDPQPDNFIIFPLYQFSAGFSLGTFTTNKKKREIEEMDVLIANAKSNQHKLKTRSETLTKYRKMLLAIETLKVRTKAAEDAQNVYDLSNQRFKNADMELVDLLRASEAANIAEEKRLTAQTDIELARLSLEEIIGVKWETAQKFEERYKK